MASGGKGARKRQKDKRRALKRSRKAAMTAQYESWRDAGTNGKSKRNKLRSKRSKKAHTKHQHTINPCGNAGCSRCYPRDKNFVRANPRLFVKVDGPVIKYYSEGHFDGSKATIIDHGKMPN